MTSIRTQSPKLLLNAREAAVTPTNDQPLTLLLTPKQAAEALAVSPRKLWSMTFEDRPALTHVRCGRLVRYFCRDLEDYIESRRCNDTTTGRADSAR